MSATVPRLWSGETAVCIASGPSLTQADVDYVRGKARVIAINASYTLATWADVLYAADAKVFRWYWKTGPKGFERSPIKSFQGLKYSLSKGPDIDKSVIVLRKGMESGLSLNPAVLHTGKNSGYQAINLAVLFGASRILLLGYDMQPGPKGQEHWHVDHPNLSRSTYAVFLSHFPSLVEPLKAAGVEVINCTRRTALTCFPHMSLEQALPMPVESVA